jgi:hypothetical protein
MHSPQTFDEYKQLIKQAVVEADELRMCLEDEEGDDDFRRYHSLILELDHQLRQLQSQIDAGHHEIPATDDLPFMAIVAKMGDRLPFKQLLITINTSHRSGL